MTKDKKIYKYYNVLDFCYDIDYKQFSRIIIYPLIIELEHFYSNKYCNDYYNIYDKESLDLRKSLEFTYKEIYINRLQDDKIKEHFNRSTDEDKLSNPEELFKLFFDNCSKKPNSKARISNFKIGIIYESTKIHNLLRLLYSKRSNIVNNLNFNGKTDHNMFDVLKPGKYKVDDCIENELNKENIFKLVNKFIAINTTGRNRSEILVFNYDESMKLKKLIKEEIEDEDNDTELI